MARGSKGLAAWDSDGFQVVIDAQCDLVRRVGELDAALTTAEPAPPDDVLRLAEAVRRSLAVVELAAKCGRP